METEKANAPLEDKTQKIKIQQFASNRTKSNPNMSVIKSELTYKIKKEPLKRRLRRHRGNYSSVDITSEAFKTKYVKNYEILQAPYIIVFT
jgi:hypothetical protein